MNRYTKRLVFFKDFLNFLLTYMYVSSCYFRH